MLSFSLILIGKRNRRLISFLMRISSLEKGINLFSRKGSFVTEKEGTFAIYCEPCCNRRAPYQSYSTMSQNHSINAVLHMCSRWALFRELFHPTRSSIIHKWEEVHPTITPYKSPQFLVASQVPSPPIRNVLFLSVLFYLLSAGWAGRSLKQLCRPNPLAADQRWTTFRKVGSERGPLGTHSTNK